MDDIYTRLQMDNPDQRTISNMLVMEMYLDAVFDSNPDVSRPQGDRRSWGVAACLVASGKAPSIHTWALAAQVDIVGGKDPTRDDSLLPPGTTITEKDGTVRVANGPELKPNDAEDVKEALRDFDG